MLVIRLAIGALLAWVSGLATYVGALRAIYGQYASGGDFRAVCFWSAIAFGGALLGIYLPVLIELRRRLDGVQPRWPFPLVAGLLCFLPSGAIVYFWGGTLGDLFSASGLLFLLMFLVAGIVVGLSFVAAFRDEPASLEYTRPR